MASALKMDPTRTTTLRATFLADMQRRIRALKREITQQIDTDDALGLKPGTLRFNAKREWEFFHDPTKVEAFRVWLQEQIDGGLLEVDDQTGQAWTATYVASAYRRGLARAFADARPAINAPNAQFYAGQRAAFFADTFAAPELTSKLELIFTRAFDQLEGITADMAGRMSRVLAQGLADGLGPREIARKLTKEVDGMTRTRAMRLARTEVIYAHAEGQLDSFERMGIEEVGLEAEFSTAGDEWVCPLCEALDGQVFSVRDAHGIIPVHPDCRCSWLPYIAAFMRRLRSPA